MPDYYLTVQLKSDTTFGRGEGVAGLVDLEIEHDQAGMPLISGRTLKGLLVEEWANLRFALQSSAFDDAARWLFGHSGATQGAGSAMMHVGEACLPPDLRAAILADKSLTPSRVLAALTTIRRQTSIDAQDAAPEEASLRAERAVVRGTQLLARLHFDVPPDSDQLALLAACLLAVRRGGTGRNRGRGRLALLLHEGMPTNYEDASFTKACFRNFATKVCPYEDHSLPHLPGAATTGDPDHGRSKQ